MRIVSNTLWLPKKGSTTDEYEDAACPDAPVELETDLYRCAIADGATEASFSRQWAKLLVDGFVNEANRDELKKTWAEGVTGKQLSWYAEQKAESGAYAALLGLVLKGHTGRGGTWEAEAIGDCCMVLVRDGNFLDMFPLTESEQFNSSPVLLSSNLDETPAETAEETFVRKNGLWSPGDTIYLLTDAIARWTYKRQEEHGDAVHFLKVMHTQKDIEELVAVQRELLDGESRRLMRNDDVTMMRIDLS